MIKLIVKLAIVALIANASWHAMTVYASYYKFKDAVQEISQFGNDKSVEQLRASILSRASDYDIPIGEDDLSVRREGQHTIVESTYSKNIELMPGYTQPWTFQIHTDTFTEPGAAPR